MAGDLTHENLISAFRGATEAECCGDGWATVTAPGRGTVVTRCPVCAREQLIAAIASFTPERFRRPIDLPAAVSEWAHDGDKAQGLYLAGQVGTGKTHAAWAALGLWCRVTGIRPRGSDRDVAGEPRRPSVIFTRMTDLLDDLRPGDYSRQRVRDCQSAALLVLDDLGAEKASEWTQERLYSVVDHRYANCLPLLVTGNLPPAKLAEQTGERTASRLAEMCQIVPMTGADRRKKAS